jgi:predicted acylesterase/phospholipase RssA
VRAAYEQQLSPLPTTYEEPVAVDPGAVQQGFATAVEGATSEQDARARVGAAAQQLTTGQNDDDRVATFRQTLPSTDWPEQPYAVTTVDAVDGSFRVFRAEDGVPLERAVAASCSVPFVWSPVRIDGHPYVDGGARSATNADVAAGHERVLVIACAPEGPSPLGPACRGVAGRGHRGGRGGAAGVRHRFTRTVDTASVRRGRSCTGGAGGRADRGLLGVRRGAPRVLRSTPVDPFGFLHRAGRGPVPGALPSVA